LNVIDLAEWIALAAIFISFKRMTTTKSNPQLTLFYIFIPNMDFSEKKMLSVYQKSADIKTDRFI